MGKILVLSDIHGNYDALKTILETEKDFDEIIVLGDLVDYGPQPNEVIDFLIENNAKILRGNHDHAVAFGVDCKCGEKTHWLSVWFRENITNKIIDPKHKSFLGRLPLSYTAGDVYFTHASPNNNLYEYIYPWEKPETLCGKLSTRKKLRMGEEKTDITNCDLPSKKIILGHTHIQFSFYFDGHLIANPGSAGQPRDGDPRASYMVIDLENGDFVLKRRKYPVERTVMKLKELGIPDPYYSALKSILVKGKI